MARKQVLGRGLDALIPDLDASELEQGSFTHCDIGAVRPNPYQPRQVFAEEELASLTNSIREKGIIQPLVVRTRPGGYELIVGERRWRAAGMAGLKKVPVVIKDVSAAEMLELALIENIQREDLNPLEKAEGYHRLMKEFRLTQEQVAKRVGQDRSTVANFLRLRNLPEPIRADIVNNRLTMGHARALLGAKTASQQKAVWRRIISANLSVRAAEALVKKLRAQKKMPSGSRPASSEAIYLESVAEDLSRHLGTKVTILWRGKTGKLEIDFFSNDDLGRLISLIKTAS